MQYAVRIRRHWTVDTISCRHTHRGIVHGGVSAMIIDEALGALVYLLKREGVLGSGAALTAQLEIKYKKVRDSTLARLGTGANCMAGLERSATCAVRTHLGAENGIDGLKAGLHEHASDCDASLPCYAACGSARTQVWLLWILLRPHMSADGLQRVTTITAVLPRPQPMPAGSTVVCTTSVESVKGRKGWLQAELRDRPDGVLFSSARALYVVASSPLLQVDGDFEPLELRRASSPLVQHETLL